MLLWQRPWRKHSEVPSEHRDWRDSNYENIHLVNGVGSLHLHVHGDKEGEEEENPAGEGQQLAGGELRVRPNLWWRIEINQKDKE